MWLLISIFLTLMFCYLFFQVGYLLLFSLAGRLLYQNKSGAAPDIWPRIAVLIPAYREDAIIYETVKQALAHSYKGIHEVYVMADGLQPETVARLRTLPAQVLEVHFEKSSKTKSLLKATQRIEGEPFELVMILDADNILAPGCLDTMATTFANGSQAIQGHRTAKNRNTPFALLDAASEEINNTIFRRGHDALSLASALIGSGMAFEKSLFVEMIYSLDPESAGEDHEMEMFLLQAGVRIAYVEQAIVLDEKVQQMAVMTRQRSRWLAVQLYYLGHYLPEFFRLRTYRNPSLFVKLLQNFLLPRVLLLALLLIWSTLMVGVYWFGAPMFPSFAAWGALLAGLILALALALPRSFYTRQTFWALFQLPMGILAMLKALLQVKGRHKEFVHTPKDFQQKP